MKLLAIPDGLTDEQYDLADRIDVALEGVGKGGLTPSTIARKTKAPYDATFTTVLAWMVEHRYAHTNGNGAWSRYHKGRAR